MAGTDRVIRGIFQIRNQVPVSGPSGLPGQRPEDDLAIETGHHARGRGVPHRLSGQVRRPPGTLRAAAQSVPDPLGGPGRPRAQGRYRVAGRRDLPLRRAIQRNSLEQAYVVVRHWRLPLGGLHCHAERLQVAGSTPDMPPQVTCGAVPAVADYLAAQMRRLDLPGHRADVIGEPG